MARTREVTAAAVYGFIIVHPGTTGEAVRIEFGAEPKRVSYLLRKLRDSGHIRGKGATRAMVYQVTAKKFT